jgi:hypothetical protein
MYDSRNQDSNRGRFVDSGERIYDLGDEMLVVCPKCLGMAKVVPKGELPEKVSKRLFAPRRLICTSCMHRDEWAGRSAKVGGAEDWYFGLPLWLMEPCCGEMLWAYSREHLEILEAYVTAKLRERTNDGRSSFLSKLPKWIKSAKNRNDILKAIGRLKEKLNG